MAQPRVFISSTYYDLKHIRSSLEHFVRSLGFEPVLSEKGGVPYSPDQALDESCYREVKNCDIYVLIIGGRYGSEAQKPNVAKIRKFYEKYESITKLEHKAAVEQDIPIYTLIEGSVYSEYYTFLKNRESQDITYAHVDSVNVFRFIDEILSQPRNNPIESFDSYSDIEQWLRLQWAGLFRDLIVRMSSQQQIETLARHVKELAEVNQTLRRYLEELISKVSPKEAPNIINSESERLAQATLEGDLRQNGFIRYLEKQGAPFALVMDNLQRAETLSDFRNGIVKDSERIDATLAARLSGIARVMAARSTFEDLNRARELLSKPRFSLTELVTIRGEPPRTGNSR